MKRELNLGGCLFKNWDQNKTNLGYSYLHFLLWPNVLEGIKKLWWLYTLVYNTFYSYLDIKEQLVLEIFQWYSNILTEYVKYLSCIFIFWLLHWFK